jgi:probable addiction module antidote protein
LKWFCNKPIIFLGINPIKDLKDQKEAAEYLNAALQDGNQEIFLMALRDVAAARGIKRLSKQTSLNRENMYRMESNEGNPNLSSLSTILDNLGFKLAIEIKEVQPSHSILSQ